MTRRTRTFGHNFGQLDSDATRAFRARGRSVLPAANKIFVEQFNGCGPAHGVGEIQKLQTFIIGPELDTNFACGQERGQNLEEVHILEAQSQGILVQ